MRAQLTAVFAGLAGLSATQGCTDLRECTVVGFEDGLLLDVDVRHEPGHYRVEVVAEGDTLALEYDLALGAQATCVGECFTSGEHLDFDSRIKGMDDLLHTRVHAATNPTSVTVRVFRADVLLVEQDLHVSYKDVEINGPGCGVDQTARATVTTP